MDGGRNSAKGFRYQYLQTLEALMSAVDDPQGIIAAIHVEGLPDADGADVDSIDYELSDASGHILETAQVKARAPGTVMGAGQIFETLARLVVKRDAVCYRLLTSAAAGESARRLLAALGSDLAVETLRDTIEGVLGPGRQKDVLAQLTDEHLARLSRARVDFDPRDNAEISEGLRFRLRRYRERSRAGLGNESAGLLIGFLLSEVFRRAERATEATIEVSHFRSLLMIDGSTLAQALGRRDWGAVIGPLPAVPDVRRGDILERLQAKLPVTAQGSAVPRCTLTGMSGIGKTSLAVGYLLERADIYEAIFWAEAESEQTLASSFSRIYRYLRGDEATVPAELSVLRDAVITDLSCLNGRWLLVMDNCYDIRQADRWMPRLGTGHIIVTTTDSAGPPGMSAPMEVTGMAPVEAVEMLRRRLDPDSEYDGQKSGKLLQLAAGLEYWPLALELASAYLNSTGLGIQGIPEYLRRLKLRSLGDSASVPLGYPRTLLQAIRLSVQPIIEKADSPQATDSWAAAFALQVIMISAYMASRQIPIYLVMSVIAIEIRSEPFRGNPGPVLADDTRWPPAEIVRMLRSQSLVNVDEPLPPDGINPDTYGFTISVNSVLQEVTRAMFDQDIVTGQIMDRLALYSERWMKSSLEMGALERTLIIVAHVSAIDQHARRLDFRTDIIEYLRGNLAAILFRQNTRDQAVHLLRSEISWFTGREEEHAKFLKCQASLQLVGPLSEYGVSSLDEIETLLESVYFALCDFAEVAPEEISFLAVELISALRSLQHTYGARDRLTMLSAATEDLSSRLPETQMSRVAHMLEEIAGCMSDHRDITSAIRLSRILLQELDDANVQEALQIRRNTRKLYVEALVADGNVDDAISELRKFIDDTQPPSMFVRQIEEIVHNTGYLCAIYSMSGSTEAADLLSQLLGEGRSELIDQHFSGIESLRLSLLRGMDAFNNGDLEVAWHHVLVFLDRHVHVENSSLLGSGWSKVANWLAGAIAGEKGKASGIPVVTLPRPNSDTGIGRFWRLAPADRMRLTEKPVRLLPLYTALAITSLNLNGTTNARCVPVCHQLQGALNYLGFSSRIIAATAVLASPGSAFDEYVGTHHGRPSLEKDGSTDGHAMLWAESFQRLVDPTILLTRTLQEAADYRAIYQPLVMFEIPDEKILVENSLLQTTLKSGINIRWRLHPEWNDFIIPKIGGNLEGALAYGQLVLAHVALEVLQGLEGIRSDFDDLRALYPQLTELLDCQRRLPDLPGNPPTEFTRVWKYGKL